MQFYDPNWKHNNHQCKKCEWQGEAIEAILGKPYGKILEILCPQCESHIALALIDNVPNYYHKQENIILHTDPSCGGTFLRDAQGVTEWEDYLCDFLRIAESLKSNVFEKYFDLDLLAARSEVLNWSIIGKGVGSLRAKISYKGRRLAILPIQYGDFESFLVVARNLTEWGIKDIIPTELAFAVMCGENEFAYRKINLARVALRYVQFCPHIIPDQRRRD